MARYKVPQNIDLQDKIFGPLTLFQFLYVLGGGMIFYVFFKNQQTILMIFVGIPAFLIGIALAFIKVNDQPFTKFIVSFVSFSLGVKKRIWRKTGQTATAEITPDKEVKKVKAPTKNLSVNDINQIAQILDNKKF
ncbi:MAG: hypothetical protein UR93_C0013G0017 [Berkelbacteria bacterium GW2011_GWA2_35_9]|uniref:PrgI family protein n=1 Tax=Berkelbacteria bacterium GW2011_GWA2_35_9 TaxID=1618333 RepID=A0A0G0G9R5_9BACT|nr:MAG: hypothetical protein UR93_C0013G0017 [Berkelbacteria bacterium GW2011_GWA2_35_9]